MSVVKWSPFREMETLHNEMNRLFSRLGGFSGANGGEVTGNQNWMLPLDIIETQDALKLKTSVPGVDPKDVNIEVNDNVLTVSAERRFEDKREEGGYHWVEQQYGTFTRSVTLPSYADNDNIQAHYNNGLLELTIPKRESAKPRRIELQANGHQPKTFESGSQPQATEPQAETNPEPQAQDKAA